MNNARVLVIEDEKEQRNIICEFVSKMDEVNSVDSADDGMQGINLIKSNHYDIIILDFIMQYLDGLEVLSFIKSLNINSKTIMISAVGKSDIIQKAFDLGLDYYLKKSFNFQNLKNVIVSLLSSKKNEFSNIYSLLMKIGIPVNLSGFNYINDTLKIMCKNRDIKSEEVYRIIARNNSTSPECVEANIRNAILSAHKNCTETYRKIFNISSSDKKPKNSIFLNILFRYLESRYYCEKESSRCDEWGSR